eukprot:IDg18951t1
MRSCPTWKETLIRTFKHALMQSSNRKPNYEHARDSSLGLETPLKLSVQLSEGIKENSMPFVLIVIKLFSQVPISNGPLLYPVFLVGQ